ncbi:MAG: hypothetical protein HYY90_03850 [Candidatus Omnitrophica bacterium]|nr:hypothetical protein [Candidatus Omnitrophota bacterium]
MRRGLGATVEEDRPKGSSATSSGSLEKPEVLRLYRKLMLARRAEERIRQEYGKDEMKTPVHLGIGQEAIPAGVCSAVPPGTTFFGTYRNHALFLALTEDSDRLFGELYGKVTGTAKGKAGSMHLGAPADGLMATSAVVGTTIPVAVGVALANQYRQSDALVVSFFGDGAVEEGVFWESFNFACLKKLRLLFVCEDNGLAIHTPADQRQGFRSLPEAARGFHCHVASGDGSDLLSVVALTRQMLERMAKEVRPGLLHFTYFRFLEHVGPREDFDAGYRPRPSDEERQRLDPVTRLERALCQSGCRPEELAVIRKAVEEQLERSVRSARAAPFAPEEELIRDVFSVDGQPSATDIRPPRCPGRGEPKQVLSFRRAINLALEHEMDDDPTVFVFGLDVPDHKRIYGSTRGLVERFGPRRCFGTPLSEDAMTGVALGAAISGLRPVHVHIRVDFLLLAMNQIANMVSTLRYMSGGTLRIPLVIRAVLRASIRDDNPVIFLEHRWLYDVEGEVDEGHVAPLESSLVRRAGKDVTAVCTSWMVIEAMKAAEVLARRGIELEVIDVRTITPLDEQTIVDSVKKTRRCVVADYDWVFCGFSAEIAALVGARCFGELAQPIERLGFAHVPCPTTRPLENLFYPSAVTIIRTVERMLELEEADVTGESFYSYEQRFKGPF